MSKCLVGRRGAQRDGASLPQGRMGGAAAWDGGGRLAALAPHAERFRKHLLGQDYSRGLGGGSDPPDRNPLLGARALTSTPATIRLRDPRVMD
jgi:hypothetical protein